MEQRELSLQRHDKISQAVKVYSQEANVQCSQARRPVFTSKKIADDIKVAEAKPDLCDADYVGYTRRHLFQRIEEHKHSAIGKHLRDAHNQRNKDLREQFTILRKCRGKFECLIYEMLFIQEVKPKLNTQSDSIKAKLFST